MTTNEELRERANAWAKDAVFRIATAMLAGDGDDKLEREFAARVVAFAEAEVSRAVRECIEAQCGWCKKLKVAPERIDDTRAMDGGVLFYHSAVDEFCKAANLLELLYQRELASKGEEA